MAEDLQTECLPTAQAEPVQSPMAHAPLGFFSQSAGLDLSVNLLNEGQAASTQLTQMLSNILSNQQFLLATYQAILATATGLSSQPIQGAAMATATIQEVTEQPSSKVKETENPDEFSKLSSEDDQAIVSDVSFTEDSEEKDEAGQAVNSEPVSKTNQQSESHHVDQKGQVIEKSSTSTTTEVLDDQLCSAEPEIVADSQSEDIRKIPTPDLLQPLDLSMAEICADNILSKLVSGKSGKKCTGEIIQVESDQPLDLRVVKAAETPKESRTSEITDRGSEVGEGRKEMEQSARAPSKDRMSEIDKDRGMTEDTRNVVVTSEEIGDYVPEYVPTPISQLQEMFSKNGADQLEKAGRDSGEREENVLGEILQEEDMTLFSPVKRRANPDVGMAGKKRRKTEDTRPALPVNVAELSERTLVTVVDTFRKAMQENVVELREMRKTMVESTVVISKMVDGLARYKKSLEDHEKEEQRREERRIELEQRREEERRRDVKRWKEDERRHDDWKREMDRRERQIDRRERELEQREKESRRDEKIRRQLKIKV